MYNLKDIKEVHLEVTSKCQARCPMCPRRPYGGPINPNIKLTEITLDAFKKWFPVEFITQLQTLSMCGNLGDPIVAKDTLGIFQYLRYHNPQMHLSMHTNGSARNSNWWKDLAAAGVRVIFGIDGLEDVHSLYRIDTDWNTVISNASLFIEAGGQAEWHMLVFKHNEHQVDECRLLSQSLGFKDFKTKHTSRFIDSKLPVINNDGNTMYTIYPTEHSINLTSKLSAIQQTPCRSIDCKSKKSSQIYVSATGIVSPCCWLDVSWFSLENPARIDYITKIGIFPNLNDMTLEQIFVSGYFHNIENAQLQLCNKHCGAIDRLGAQFV